ncbi:hypothetical protein GCM10022392_13030 [Mucilaginibacter panaciglaebae]|uniref:Uncharacterized protein n=1 Tax=Mucilaginibacter panaciglaebae TaxID=502331 RepID=A0ABP7WMI8_9SPHI
MNTQIISKPDQYYSFAHIDLSTYKFAIYLGYYSRYIQLYDMNPTFERANPQNIGVKKLFSYR